MTEIKIGGEKDLRDHFKSFKNAHILFNNKMWDRDWLSVFIIKDKDSGDRKLYYKCCKENGEPCDDCLKMIHTNIKGAKIFQSNKNKEFMKYVEKHLKDVKSDEEEEEEEEHIDAEQRVTKESDDEKACRNEETSGEEKIVPKKKKSKHSETQIMNLIEKYISPFHKRLRTLEVEWRKKKLVDGAKRYEVRGGVCKGCFKLNNDLGRRLKPSNVMLSIFKDKTARTMSSTRFNQLVVLKNKYCKECKTDNNSTCRWFASGVANDICYICRERRRHKGNLHCNTCNVPLLQSDHAQYKTPMHEAFKVLEDTVFNIKKVKTSLDFNKVDGEMRVGEDSADSVDFVITIDTVDNTKHMYFIEIMNTKNEKIAKLSKKFAAAREIVKPNKTYLIAFDIKNDADGFNLTYKIDILRRWVIFTLLYSDHLPRVTNWWFFCNSRNAYPINNLSEDANQFYLDPIKIAGPPRNIEENVDWEFSSDPFYKDTAYENKYVNVVDLMFGGSFKKDASIYALHNSDASNQFIDYSK